VRLLENHPLGNNKMVMMEKRERFQFEKSGGVKIEPHKRIPLSVC
jgi:hypothetical protein